MFHVRGVFKIFLRRAPNCYIFYKRMFFRQSKFEANSRKNGSRESGGMLYRKIFEILNGAMAFLVLSEQILIKLIAPHLEFFTKYDAFCSHIFDLCVLTSSQEWIQKIWVRLWGAAILN